MPKVRTGVILREREIILSRKGNKGCPGSAVFNYFGRKLHAGELYNSAVHFYFMHSLHVIGMLCFTREDVKKLRWCENKAPHSLGFMQRNA